MFKWRKDSDTYLTIVCRHCWSKQITMKVDKLLAVAFIGWRGKLTKVLAGAARGETGSKGGGRWVRANSQVSTSDSLTRPPPALLPFSLLAAPANTLVSLSLQLMKASVLAESSNNWSAFIVICLLHWSLQIVVR